MELYSSDNKMVVNVGESTILKSVYSTAYLKLKRSKTKMAKALEFLKSGSCQNKDGLDTARQLNLIRDAFASLSPDKAVWDYEDKSVEAPWKNGMSPVITSCANLYTTSDGKDLLAEIVGLLVYAYYSKCHVESR